MIDLYFYGRIASIVGQRHFEINFKGQTVGELLTELCEIYPQLNDVLFTSSNEIKFQVNILVNGHSVKLMKGRETSLVTGDKVTIERIDILETVGGGWLRLKQHSL